MLFHDHDVLLTQQLHGFFQARIWKLVLDECLEIWYSKAPFLLYSSEGTKRVAECKSLACATPAFKICRKIWDLEEFAESLGAQDYPGICCMNNIVLQLPNLASIWKLQLLCLQVVGSKLPREQPQLHSNAVSTYKLTMGLDYEPQKAA